MQHETHAKNEAPAAIVLWLWILFGTVFMMVWVGGITRLTGSGLSMVDWRPVRGVLPPIGDAAWSEVFTAYQGSPEYREVNAWMELEDFKRIFFWEYLHRLLGRFVGLVAFLPWLYFRASGRLAPWVSTRVVIAIVLGGAQGLLGWHMVQSGLVDRPEVSHLRLAAHLGLAFTIAMWLLWLLLDLHFGRARLGSGAARTATLPLLTLLGIQIAYGAFMAGTRAGILFPAFPDMNGHYLPGGLVPEGPFVEIWFHHPIAIHYVHRALGFALLAWGGVTWWSLRRRSGGHAWVCDQFLAVLVLQFALGAFAALYQAPLGLSLVHQSGAFALACSTILLLHHAARLEPAD